MLAYRCEPVHSPLIAGIGHTLRGPVRARVVGADVFVVAGLRRLRYYDSKVLGEDLTEFAGGSIVLFFAVFASLLAACVSRGLGRSGVRGVISGIRLLGGILRVACDAGRLS